ncbi:MAG TPA: hypothetical protein VKR55_26005 [Bradyrhizobium sp.]|uniref:hypothetical protein n=1 Tax=Bradyrhizobium sp. TaxID=376 RepID=UPI002C267481|nr:hypothetical protein [Bradyrhizobium sp.]HLZ05591.1 hypothetical protein [Bradyrhizobium sp.]
MSHVTRRIRNSRRVADYDREIVANARAVIERSLQILRDSRVEIHLGRNYYVPIVANDFEYAGEVRLRTVA